ncbi:MAG: hypothetical protein ACREP1_08170, partial [Rhodanobacteraceae bacterium]
QAWSGGDAPARADLRQRRSNGLGGGMFRGEFGANEREGGARRAACRTWNGEGKHLRSPRAFEVDSLRLCERDRFDRLQPGGSIARPGGKNVGQERVQAERRDECAS